MGMTGNRALVKLQELKAGGCSHNTLVTELCSMSTCGYDISDDKTMVLAYFNRTCVLVSPYHNVELFDKK